MKWRRPAPEPLHFPGGFLVATPPEIQQAIEIRRLRALLGELGILLERFGPGDVCLREWDEAHACPCGLCAMKRVIRYGV
jgi:hypothetical protein